MYPAKKVDCFMPFGSAMNAWGQANQGHPVTAKELTEVMEVIYLKAKELMGRENAPVHVYQPPAYPKQGSTTPNPYQPNIN